MDAHSPAQKIAHTGAMGALAGKVLVGDSRKAGKGPLCAIHYTEQVSITFFFFILMTKN